MCAIHRYIQPTYICTIYYIYTLTHTHTGTTSEALTVEQNAPMLLDDILEAIGQFGVYQICTYTLLGLTGVPTGNKLNKK